MVQQQVFLQPSPEQSTLGNDMSEADFVPKKLTVCLGVQVGDIAADRELWGTHTGSAERRLHTGGFRLFQDPKTWIDFSETCAASTRVSLL